MLGIKFNREVSLASVVGWFFTIFAFVWVVASGLSDANSAIKDNQKSIQDYKNLLNKISDKTDEHSRSLIKLRSKDENLEQQLDQIRRNTDYNRSKLDKIYEKISGN